MSDSDVMTEWQRVISSGLSVYGYYQTHADYMRWRTIDLCGPVLYKSELAAGRSRGRRRLLTVLSIHAYGGPITLGGHRNTFNDIGRNDWSLRWSKHNLCFKSSGVVACACFQCGRCSPYTWAKRSCVTQVNLRFAHKPCILCSKS